MPTTDRRIRLPYAKALGVLVRSLLVEREPMYRQHQTVATFAPAAFGLDPEGVERLSDDAMGRALDRLFDADRGTLMIERATPRLEPYACARRTHWSPCGVT